jgi:hypothetical protein
MKAFSNKPRDYETKYLQETPMFQGVPVKCNVLNSQPLQELQWNFWVNCGSPLAWQ